MSADTRTPGTDASHGADRPAVCLQNVSFAYNGHPVLSLIPI